MFLGFLGSIFFVFENCVYLDGVVALGVSGGLGKPILHLWLNSKKVIC